MDAPASLLDLISHGGSMRAAQDNTEQAALIDHTRAATDFSRAQTIQERMKIQAAQQSQRDAQIMRDIMAGVGIQQAKQQQATVNAPARLPGGLINRSGGPIDGVPSVGATPPFLPPGTASAPTTAQPAPPVQQPSQQTPDYFADPRALAMEVARRGGSAAAVQGAYANGIKMNTDLAQMTKEQLANEKENHAIVADSLQGYLENPTPEAYATFRAQAIQREPGLAQELPPSGAPTQKDLAHVIGAVHLTDRLIATAEKRQTMTNAGRAAEDVHTRQVAELPGVQADAAVKVAEQPVKTAIAAATAADPDKLTPEQRFQAKRAEALAAETARHNVVEEKLGMGRLNVSGAELQLRNKEFQQKYGDALGEMSPNNKAIAAKLAIGEFDPAQLGRIPGKEQIIAGAIAMNPNWTPQTYATKKAFTDPEKGQAKNLGTISRIVGHIGRFEENSQKMGYSPLYATGMNLTGDQNKLHEDSHAIAAELEKLVSGGVGSMEQTKSWQKSLSSPSASARQKAIDEISQLIGSQYEGMNQTYKAGVGSDLPIDKYVSPQGRDWMKKKGINVNGEPAPAAGAKPGAAAFKAGDTRTVDGVKYTRNEKGEWHPE
jgi:hypothetical protein